MIEGVHLVANVNHAFSLRTQPEFDQLATQFETVESRHVLKQTMLLVNLFW